MRILLSNLFFFHDYWEEANPAMIPDKTIGKNLFSDNVK